MLSRDNIFITILDTTLTQSPTSNIKADFQLVKKNSFTHQDVDETYFEKGYTNWGWLWKTCPDGWRLQKRSESWYLPAAIFLLPLPPAPNIDDQISSHSATPRCSQIVLCEDPAAGRSAVIFHHHISGLYTGSGQTSILAGLVGDRSY